MGISQYIKEIGRGPRGARPLDREQAADLHELAIEHGNPGPCGSQRTRRGFAEAGGSSGHDGNLILNLHITILFKAACAVCYEAQACCGSEFGLQDQGQRLVIQAAHHIGAML